MNDINSSKKTALLILDGWGISPKKEVSALAQGNTPFFDRLSEDNLSAKLLTDGLNVGLPEGQMGNSEVGHMNIGSGRIIFQDLVKINKSIENGSFKQFKILQNALNKAVDKKQVIHIIGLISDGGIHSHINHLLALIELIDSFPLNNIFIHAITDGRDTDPKSAKQYIQTVIDAINNTRIEIASLIGRYYAMDRDKRWERIEKAYNLMCNGEGLLSNNLIESIEKSYEQNITDEFINPINCSSNPKSKINDGDLVIFFNYRADRPRELTEVLSQHTIDGYEMTPKKLDFISFTNYNTTYQNIDVLFEKDKLTNTLGAYLSKNNKTQIRIAETEKYAHVTYFFNGGNEKQFPGEERILVPSPKVATYDLKPEMSAYKITEKIITHIQSNNSDFICLNYANTDMVGHTGDFNAAIKAANAVDNCLIKLIPVLRENGYETIIIADHGNSDNMINIDGTPNTQHSLNPVPIVFVPSYNNLNDYTIKSGKLADISPTILSLMDLSIPPEMDGNVLLIKK